MPGRWRPDHFAVDTEELARNKAQSLIEALRGVVIFNVQSDAAAVACRGGLQVAHQAGANAASARRGDQREIQYMQHLIGKRAIEPSDRRPALGDHQHLGSRKMLAIVPILQRVLHVAKRSLLRVFPRDDGELGPTYAGVELLQECYILSGRGTQSDAIRARACHRLTSR